MKLIESKPGREIYDMENGYTVVKEECSWSESGFRFRFCTKENDFLPAIYECEDGGNNEEQPEKSKFEIQTTSYGALSPADIEKVINGYKKALDTIKELERVFKSREKEVTA